MAGSQAGLVHSSPDQPGVASGVFTFVQLATSALIAQLVATLLGYGAIAIHVRRLFLDDPKRLQTIAHA